MVTRLVKNRTTNAQSFTAFPLQDEPCGLGALFVCQFLVEGNEERLRAVGGMDISLALHPCAEASCPEDVDAASDAVCPEHVDRAVGACDDIPRRQRESDSAESFAVVAWRHGAVVREEAVLHVAGLELFDKLDRPWIGDSVQELHCRAGEGEPALQGTHGLGKKGAAQYRQKRKVLKRQDNRGVCRPDMEDRADYSRMRTQDGRGARAKLILFDLDGTLYLSM